ncbi:hypothetical protein ACHAW6_003222 [Cyclotella cf. meneghiniana]
METGIMDSGASLSCGGLNDEFIQMGQLSSKTYMVTLGQIVLVAKRAKLVHNLSDLESDMEIVPAMAENLLGVGQFEDAGYVKIFDDQLVKIFNGKNVVSDDAVVRGWQDPASGLYWIPLKAKVESWNTDTILLDEQKTRQIQELRPRQVEAIHNV